MSRTFWSQNLKGGDHLEDLDVDGRIIRWILRKYGMGHRSNSYGAGQGPVAGPFEHDNEPAGFINFLGC
jgi:hypothetical protein